MTHNPDVVNDEGYPSPWTYPTIFIHAYYSVDIQAQSLKYSRFGKDKRDFGIIDWLLDFYKLLIEKHNKINTIYFEPDRRILIEQFVLWSSNNKFIDWQLFDKCLTVEGIWLNGKVVKIIKCDKLDDRIIRFGYEER